MVLPRNFQTNPLNDSHSNVPQEIENMHELFRSTLFIFHVDDFSVFLNTYALGDVLTLIWVHFSVFSLNCLLNNSRIG